MRVKNILPELYRRKRSKSLNDISDIFQDGLGKERHKHSILSDLLWEIEQGDIDAVKRYNERGFDMDLCDYDKRTPLHIAAAEGNVEIVRYLINVCKVDKRAQDRWHFTAYDEAKRIGHTEIVALLAGNPGHYRIPCEDTDEESFLSISDRTDTELQEKTLTRLLYRVKEGNLTEIKRFNSAGMDMNQDDYDNRTALHIAAAEGHLNIVKYLVEECNVNLNMTDRWGNLAINEATKFGHTNVQTYLEACTKQRDVNELSLSKEMSAEFKSDNTTINDSHETFTKNVRADIAIQTDHVPHELY